MKKIILASGCSFTFEDWCWPGHLSKSLDIEIKNVAMSGQGNGLISKKIIPSIDELLKTYDKSEILVGIMWSGIDRHEYYTDDVTDIKYWGGYLAEDISIINPTDVISSHYNWRIMNHHWGNNIPQVKMYYKNFHHGVSSMILTIEHILRIQWYLNSIGVTYFMTTYMDIFKGNLINHGEVKYLYDKIDFTKFLPIRGCYEWVTENYNEYGMPTDKGDHPTSFGHEMFSKEVIMPYLNQHLLI